MVADAVIISTMIQCAVNLASDFPSQSDWAQDLDIMQQPTEIKMFQKHKVIILCFAWVADMGEYPSSWKCGFFFKRWHTLYILNLALATLVCTLKREFRVANIWHLVSFYWVERAYHDQLGIHILPQPLIFHTVNAWSLKNMIVVPEDEIGYV